MKEEDGLGRAHVSVRKKKSQQATKGKRLAKRGTLLGTFLPGWSEA